MTYTTKDGAAHEFDALKFLAALSCHVPKTYESITRYYGRYSCRQRGERAKIHPHLPKNTRAITGKSFVRVVGSHASSSAQGFGGQVKRILLLVHRSFSGGGSAPVQSTDLSRRSLKGEGGCASSSFAFTRYGGQVAFIQDAHSIKDIMKAQGIPDFFIRRSLGAVGQAPASIPKFINTSPAIDELPAYDSFEPAPDDF